MENMNITSAQYCYDVLTEENTSIRATIDGVEMSVPIDPANRHYSAIMQAVADGQLTIQEASE
jgi:hypothetical protein